MIPSVLLAIGAAFVWFATTVGTYMVAGIGLGVGFAVAKMGIDTLSQRKFNHKAKSVYENLKSKFSRGDTVRAASGITVPNH